MEDEYMNYKDPRWVKNQLFLEGQTEKVGELALKLSFSKNRVELLDWSGCPWEKVQYLLKRTAKSGQWYSDSKAYNKERGTNLGTMGYLPGEIRNKIWRAMLEPPNEIELRRKSSELQRQLTNLVYQPGLKSIMWEKKVHKIRAKCREAYESEDTLLSGRWKYSIFYVATIPLPKVRCSLYSIHAIRTALESSRTELDCVFLNTSIDIRDSDSLLHFLDMPQDYLVLVRMITIWLFSDVKDEDKKILLAVPYLPQGLTSVTLKFRRVKKWTYRKTFEKQLCMLDQLNKKILRACPNAMIKIPEDGEFFRDISPLQRAQIKAVMVDFEK